MGDLKQWHFLLHSRVVFLEISILILNSINEYTTNLILIKCGIYVYSPKLIVPQGRLLQMLTMGS